MASPSDAVSVTVSPLSSLLLTVWFFWPEQQQ